MNEIITLFRGTNSWNARFHDDAKIIDLFGTDTLPTPYTLDAPLPKVYTEIQAQNPNATILHNGKVLTV